MPLQPLLLTQAESGDLDYMTRIVMSFATMNPTNLRSARQQRGWSEQEAARRLGVSQSYLSMLEGRKPRLTSRVARRAMSVFGLPPTVLPPSPPEKQWGAETLAQQLAALEYPGFAYIRSHGPKRNPAEVLVGALSNDQPVAPVAEALPWVLLRCSNMDWAWPVEQAKVRDLQNRLGFVASLARLMSEKADPLDESRTRSLSELERNLNKSRLAKEDTLGKPARSATEREWVLANRTEEAKHWNLLTDWRPEHFQHAF
jgi:transcriptional regulator with XRE-family HTH domain